MQGSPSSESLWSPLYLSPRGPDGRFDAGGYYWGYSGESREVYASIEIFQSSGAANGSIPRTFFRKAAGVTNSPHSA